jgi:hypothetical protein
MKINKLVVLHADHYELDSSGVDKISVIKKKIETFETFDWNSVPIKPTLFSHFPMRIENRDTKISLSVTPSATLMLEHLRRMKKKYNTDIQIHVHHERWTNSSLFKHDVNIESDEERFIQYIKFMKSLFIEYELHNENQNWFFVHGCWSLNASDEEMCRIENEIKILYSLGCRGDFTFPSSRKHCSPMYSVPFVVDPLLVGKKCYDGLYHDFVIDKIDKSKFFIFNQPLENTYTSLEHVIEELKQNQFDTVIGKWITGSVEINGVNYIKTHCHSANDKFFLNNDKIFLKKNKSPILLSEYKELLKRLSQYCGNKNIILEFKTISNFYNDLLTDKIEQDIYGNTKREKCPVCYSYNLNNIWKIPLTSVDKITVNGANLNKIPLLNSKKRYSFSKCTDCHSIMLDPYSSAYWDDRNETHHVEKAKNKELWDSYIKRIQDCIGYVKNKDVMADIACGGGQCLTIAKELNLGFKKFIGIDTNKDSIEYIKSLGFIGFVDTVCKPLNFKADFIIFAEAFEHVEDQKSAMNNISDALNKDGILYMTAQALESDLPVRPEESVYVNKSTLEKLLMDRNIEIIQIVLSSGRWKVIGRKT